MENKNKCFEVIVKGIVVDEDGLILLAKNKKHKNKYTFFGGHLEPQEKLGEAVQREIKEEAGIGVLVKRQIRFSDDIRKGSNKHFIFFDFLCFFAGKKDDVKLDEKEFEKDDYVWVDPEGALKMDISSSAERIIKAYLEEKKKDEYLSGWKRCMADFENYKKRQLESNRFLGNHAKEEMILQILPVLDNFEASLDHVPEDKKDDAWVTGITYIQKQVENILKENGVCEIETKVGDEFDPEIHEALKNEEKSKGNKIKKIVLKGYKMGDKIIRAVKVVVG